jgi:hypothetical protein
MPSVVVIDEGVEVIEIEGEGPQGIQGEQGTQGPPGPSDAFRAVFSQDVPATTWEVVHNLGGRPNVTVVDSAGTVWETGVEYVDDDHLRVTVSAPFSGKVYLS